MSWNRQDSAWADTKQTYLSLSLNIYLSDSYSLHNYPICCSLKLILTVWTSAAGLLYIIGLISLKIKLQSQYFSHNHESSKFPILNYLIKLQLVMARFFPLLTPLHDMLTLCKLISINKIES